MRKKKEKIQIKDKRLIPMLVLAFVILIGVWGASKLFLLNLIPNLGYDLLINLAADALFVLFSLVLIDKLRRIVKSSEWRGTKRFFFRMVILALNGFILDVLEVFDPSGRSEVRKWGEQKYWLQRYLKFLDLDEEVVSERYRKLSIRDKEKLMASFIKLRTDLYEVTTLFGDKFDDPKLFMDLSRLLAFTRDASEFVIQTKESETSSDEGIPSHVLTLLLAVGQFYITLKKSGASEHLIL